MSFKQAYLETSVSPVREKSVRKLVSDDKQKSIEAMAVGDFVWGKVKQHKMGVTLTVSAALNFYLVYNFIAYGVK